jgi:hypothetical protein
MDFGDGHPGAKRDRPFPDGMAGEVGKEESRVAQRQYQTLFYPLA